MLPDVAADAAATDASQRAADLDCDAHDAREHDCDDLRAELHDDQDETCDGLDTNCDGRTLELVEGCTLAGGACGGEGITYCENTANGGVAGTCQPDATCACESQLGCHRCTLDYRDVGASKALCAPAVGKLHPAAPCSDDAPCAVEVLAVSGPFEVKLALAEIGPFSQRLAGVGTNYLYLRARHLAGDTTTAPASSSVGSAILAFTTGVTNRPVLVPVELSLASGAEGGCLPTTTPNIDGNVAMTCAP